MLVEKISKSRDSKIFWELIKSHRFKSINNEDAIELKDWHEFFKEFLGTRSSTLSNSLNIQGRNPNLDSIITIDEVIVSLNKCKEGKSAGPDGLGYEFFKNLPYKWILEINSLFNKILDKEEIPKSWAEIHVRMLYKNKGDKSDPNSYRPIALVHCITKIFTQVLGKRLTDWVENLKLLPEHQ